MFNDGRGLFYFFRFRLLLVFVVVLFMQSKKWFANDRYKIMKKKITFIYQENNRKLSQVMI